MTAKSREATRANREGTSKAGKGPLKHHEENRKGPGQKKREGSTEGKQSDEETQNSSEEAGKKLRKTGKDRGGRRPPRQPSRREQESNQQDQGRAREERRWTMEVLVSEVGGKRVCKDRAPQLGGRFVSSVRAARSVIHVESGIKWRFVLLPFSLLVLGVFPFSLQDLLY